MAEMFDYGITITLVCVFCGKRHSYKTRAKRDVHLTNDWMEATIDYPQRHFYSDSREELLFCSRDHATKYKALETKAAKAADDAFRQHIRQGQCRARSAVDALADVERADA